jgi:WD40 repeat protein
LDISFSPDGKRLAGACGHLGVVDLATGKETRMAGVDGVLAYVVAVSPDGTTVATGYTHGVGLWDFKELVQERKLDSDGLDVKALAFSPDSKVIAAAGRQFGKGALIQLWDVRTGKRLHSMSGHRFPVESLAFTPDGKALISGSIDDVRWWDPATGKEIRLDKARGPIALSRDGKLLATATDDGGIKLWDAATGKGIRAVGPSQGRVQSLALSPDGNLLASTNPSPSIALWDVATGKPALSFPGHTKPIVAVGFARDGKALASRAADGSLAVWDLPAASQRHRFDLGTDPGDNWGRPLAFSPGGKSLAAPSPQRRGIILWDPDTGKEQREVRAADPAAGSNYPASGVDFSPDGGTVAGLSFLGGIRL